MPRQKNNRKNEKRRVGRPKGGKAILRLPIKSLKETVEIIKSISEKSGNRLLPFKALGGLVGWKPKQTARMLGSLQNDYNLFNKEPNNLYILSEFGKRVASENYNAIKEMFSKNSILLDLFNQFGNVDIGKEGLESYLNNRYKKGANKEQIIQRFLEDKAYLESMRIAKEEPAKEGIGINNMQLFKLVLLDFSLNPPKFSELAEDVASEFEDIDDETLKTLAKIIGKNKDNKDFLIEFVRTLFDIISRDYARDYRSDIIPAYKEYIAEKNISKVEKQKPSEKSEDKEKKTTFIHHDWTDKHPIGFPKLSNPKKKDKDESVEGDLTGNQD